MKFTLYLLCLLLLGCATICEGVPESSLRISLTGPRKAGDSIRAFSEGKKTVLDLRSQNGIGRAEIFRGTGPWPAQLTFRLHLKAMESFSVGNGQITLRTEIPTSNSHLTLREMQASGEKRATQVPEGSPFWMDVQVVGAAPNSIRRSSLTSGYFELTLPKALLTEEAEKLSIQWVDFFR